MDRQIFIILANAECMDSQPRPVDANGTLLGYALHDHRKNTHLLEIPEATFLKHARDLAMGAMMPMSKWYVHGIRIVDELGESEDRLMAELEKLQTALADLTRDRDLILQKLRETASAPETVPVPFPVSEAPVVESAPAVDVIEAAPVEPVVKRLTFREWRKVALEAGVDAGIVNSANTIEALKAAIGAKEKAATSEAA